MSFVTSTISQSYSNQLSTFLGDLGISPDNYYLTFAGDVNQDGIVDTSDMNEGDNGSTSILIGYNSADVKGDGIVDTSDMNIVDNNSTAIVMVSLPY